MADLLIFDIKDDLLTILSSEDNEACRFWDAPFEEILNNGSSFEFSAEGNHEDSKYIVEGNQVAFKDKDGYFRLFVISELNLEDGEEGPFIRAICEPAINELNDEPIEDVRPYNTTLEDANTRVLAKTRWKVGITDDLGLNSINHYYTTVKDAIIENINTWKAEYRDRVEISDNKIVGRYIDSLFRRGEDTGKLWEMDKDILKLQLERQFYPKTAMYGRGASLQIEGEDGEATGGYTRKITFADVEWKVSNGDPVDKPLGQEWVGDPEALQAFGRYNDDGTRRHRFGFYESDQEDPAKLLQETWESLQSAKNVFTNLVLEVQLLGELLGYEHEKVRLGDTTRAINRNFTKPIEFEERVVRIVYDISIEEDNGEVELGNYIDVYSEDKRLEQVIAKVNDRSPIWDKGGEGSVVDDDSIENVIPETPTNVIATGMFKKVLVEWDYVNKIYIANYEVYASQVSGFTPSSANLVFKGKTSTFDFDADVNQQWYFRVRAINTHGVAGGFSQEVSAQTARIIADDILFGEDIAAKLRELSEVTDILGQGTIAIDQLKQDTIDAINAGAKQYTEEEIRVVREKLEGDINTVNTSLTNTAKELNDKATELQGLVDSNKEQIEAAGGKITLVEQEVDTIGGKLNTTITELSSLDGVVSQQQTTISAMSGEIALKADATKVYTKTETDGKITTAVNAAKAEIKVTTDSITQTVSNLSTTVNGIEIGGRNLVTGTSKEFKSITFSSWDAIFPNRVMDWQKQMLLTGRIYLKPTNQEASIMIHVRYTNGSYNQYRGNIIAAGSEGYSTVTITVPNRDDIDRIEYGIRHSSSSTPSDLVRYKEAKIEKGNKPTDWSPAPEDIDNEFATVNSTISTISQKADSISLSVTDLSKDYNTTKSKVSTLEITTNGLSTSVSSLTNEMEKKVSRKGYQTSNTSGDNSGKWTLFARTRITSRYQHGEVSFDITGGADGSSRGKFASLFLRNKQQNVLGAATFVDLSLSNSNFLSSSDFLAICTKNTTSKVIVEYYIRIRATYEQYFFQPFNESGNITSIEYLSNQGFKTDAELPSGDRFTGINSGALGRVVSAETSITQLSTEISLKASQTSVNDLTSRMSKAESTITVQAGQISSKVDKNGVISSINQTSESIKINAGLIDLQGDVYITSGKTVISNLAVETAMIANAAITKAKIANLAVGTAQIENSAITNAKIANASIDNAKIASLDASKIKTGTLTAISISGVTITGSTITSSANNSVTQISGGNLSSTGTFDRTFSGTQVATYVSTLDSYNGVVRVGITSKKSNGIERVDSSGGRATMLTDKTVTTQRAIHSGSQNKNGARFIDFFANETLTSGVQGLGMHIFSGQDMRIEATQGITLTRAGNSDNVLFVDGDMRARQALVNTIQYNNDFSGVNIYIKPSATGEVRFTAANTTDSYVDIRARQVFSNTIQNNDGVNGGNIYIKPAANGELRVTLENTLDTYIDIRARQLFANTLQRNSGASGTNIYIKPAGGGEVRATVENTTDSYVPMRASSFPTGSMAEYKQDITVHKDSALKVINSSVIYDYRLISEVAQGKDRIRTGLVIGENYHTPECVIDGDGVEQYMMNSLSWLAIQELSKEQDDIKAEVMLLRERVGKLEKENEILKQKVA